MLQPITCIIITFNNTKSTVISNMTPVSPKEEELKQIKQDNGQIFCLHESLKFLDVPELSRQFSDNQMMCIYKQIKFIL